MPCQIPGQPEEGDREGACRVQVWKKEGSRFLWHLKTDCLASKPTAFFLNFKKSLAQLPNQTESNETQVP